jgi:hypothetical protein
MSASLIIPENINDLSSIEQVLLFHDAGAVVFAIDPPGKRKSNGKTLNKPPGKKRPSQPERDEVYHQFGNGNDFNAGVYPPVGYLIVNLDAVDKDRGSVDRFLERNPTLADVPHVQTARGYHLYFRADAPPRTLLKPSIVPNVNFHVITSEKYVIVPPSRHADGLKYIWRKTGEPPLWTQEIAAAFNLPEEQPEPQDDAQEQQAGNGARVGYEGRPDHVLGLPIPGLIVPGNDREHLDFMDGIEIHLLANQIFKRLAETNEYFVQSQSRKLVRYDRTARLAEVSADQLRIRLGKLYRVRRTKGLGQVQLHPATASKEDALLLLASGDEMRKHLDEVERVVKHPLLVSEENGEPKIIASREVHNGVFVDSSDVIPVVSLSEAVPAILGLFCDFKFTTPSDLSRAVGHLLSPALVFGGLVPGRVPFHIVEADYPGSGKGFLQDLVLAIYNEEAGIITEINKGVGGIEETLSRRLMDGFAFVQFDNWRLRLFCQMLESALTQKCAAARALHADAMVSTEHAFFMLTSNGAEFSPDLSDRSVFVRIQKQADGYRWHKFEDGKKAMQHVQSQRTFYLGCVYSILSEWVRQGKPQIDGSPHRFEDWAGSMDWIVQHLFSLPPLLDGHREVQKQVASPILVFLRQAAIQVEKEGLLADPLKASALVELAQRHNLTFPGLKDYDDQAAKTLGIRLGQVFKQSDTLNLDSYQIVRVASTVKRDDNKGYNPAPAYVFFRTPGSPDLQKGPSDRGNPESNGPSDRGNPELSPNTPSGGEKDPVSPDSLQLPCNSPASQKVATSRGTQPPQHQVDTSQKPAFPLPPLEVSSIFSQDLSPVVNEIDEGVVEKKIGGVAGVAGDFTDLTEKLSPVASPSCADMSFYLMSKKSELAAVADTLAGIQEPLAIELKTYDRSSPGPQHISYDNEVRLLSIKAPGLPPWLLDLKEAGYDLGELKNVLQSHELIMDDAKSTVRLLWTSLQIELKQGAWCKDIAIDLLNYAKETTGYRIPFELARFLADEPRDPGTCTDKQGYEYHKTDWQKPLTDTHYGYAAATVEYLIPLKTLLEQALVESQMLTTFRYENSKAANRPAVTSFMRGLHSATV